jgi:hypothetical protein
MEKQLNFFKNKISDRKYPQNALNIHGRNIFGAVLQNNGSCRSQKVKLIFLFKNKKEIAKRWACDLIGYTADHTQQRRVGG